MRTKRPSQIPRAVLKAVLRRVRPRRPDAEDRLSAARRRLGALFLAVFLLSSFVAVLTTPSVRPKYLRSDPQSQ